jgi:hypothetical protein
LRGYLQIINLIKKHLGVLTFRSRKRNTIHKMSFDHIGYYVPADQLEAEVTFLLKALAHLDVVEFKRPMPDVVGMGLPHAPNLWVAAMRDARTTGDPAPPHIAFRANSTQTVSN